MGRFISIISPASPVARMRTFAASRRVGSLHGSKGSKWGAAVDAITGMAVGMIAGATVDAIADAAGSIILLL